MKIETQTHRSRFGVGLLLAVLGACAIGIWLLSADARRELDALANANAERLPVADNSQDVVTCIYLFHELPPKIRRVVAAELARVLKPGGRLIFVDALQKGDTEGMDALLDFFPWAFHEPYFDSYTKEDLTTLFSKAGLTPLSETPVFLSKVMSFEKS